MSTARNSSTGWARCTAPRSEGASTGKGFQGWDTDAKLLAYLYNHKHATPFEMAGMVIEVKAPIFVFREWHRHRTQSYNEMSARYIPAAGRELHPAGERHRGSVSSDVGAFRSGAGQCRQMTSSTAAITTSAKAIEPWDYIAANGIGFFEGSAIKYLTRWKEKGGVEDLKKAQHYIQKLIEISTAPKGAQRRK